METIQTFINLHEIRDYYKEHCDNEDRVFEEKEFEKFVKCCERDFFQWLADNMKYFKMNELN